MSETQPGEIVDQWIDGAVGETRHALAKNGRAFALVVTRWSDEGRRARWGETYVGRVRAEERGLRGAFVDLGLKGEDGFLPLRKDEAVREGERLIVHVEREGVRGKGPNISRVELAGEGQKLGRVGRHRSDEMRDEAGAASLETRAALDALIDEATSKTVPLAGGGKLIIEPTAALVAIDVDSAGRRAKSDAERFALELNQEAAREALRQLRLRNLGGQAAIDFVAMRHENSRRALLNLLDELKPHDPWGLSYRRPNGNGAMLMSRAQYQRPLHEMLMGEDGRKTPETVALEALRALERETAAVRGRKIVARVAREVADWLDSGVIAWRPALEARIGTLWEIEPADVARENIDVRAV